MITYANFQKRPAAASSLIGMTLPAFERLYADFEPAHTLRLEQTTLTKRHKRPRTRAVGAGRPHRYCLRDRLLMTLFWLRVYTPYEVIGFFFTMNKTNVEDNLKDCLATLESMAQFAFERPSKERRKLRSVKEVMDAFPDVALVIDAKEQRIQRPKNKKKPTDETQNNQEAQGSRHGDEDAGSAVTPPEAERNPPPPDIQKPYYSGKKKTHTLKNQIGVRPDGLIEAVSESVPGGANHDITLLRASGLLGELDSDEAAMTDKGYDGIQKDYPHTRIYQPFKARRGHPLTDEQKAYNQFLSKYRIVVEHTNAHLNKFQVLAQTYRHQRDSHTSVFRVVAGLVNRQITEKPLKTYSVAA
jgi:hypothetical protein